MELIKPKAEVLIQGYTLNDIYKHIELCGRTCYKSEDRIKEGSAEKFIDMLVNNRHFAMFEHGTVYLKIPVDKYEHDYAHNPYSLTDNQFNKDTRGINVTTNLRVIHENYWYDDLQYLCEPTIDHEKRYTVRVITNRAVSHQLVRHRTFSFCLSGDSIITSFRGNKKWTVKQLYDWQFDSRFKGKLKLMNIRSVDETSKIIVPNKINKVWKTGIKDVYEVTTRSGRKIKTTMEHRYFTPEGYKKLKELKVGDYIYANGLELLDNEEWLYENYIVQNKTRKEIANIIGCCESLVNRAFRKFNIVKPHSAYPNRKPGYGRKGRLSAEALEKIRTIHMGKNNKGWKDNKTENGARSYTRRNYKKDVCEFCGKTSSLEQHHWDKNAKNYAEDNVITLCVQCHKLVHNIGTKGVFSDKIISIEYVGKEETYDIEMQGIHNFVANGLVVHNSQESQRFINYAKKDSITFIEPAWYNDTTNSMKEDFEKMLRQAENNYFLMSERGFKPQQARAVLPNATKTEIIMTGFVSDWERFFEMRLLERTGKVDPDMKTIAYRIFEALMPYIPQTFM